MIDFDSAIKIAQDYFEKRGSHHLTKIYEAEKIWVVYAGTGNQLKYGNAGISIDKVSGEIQKFILPSRSNYELLQKSTLTLLDQEALNGAV